MKKRNGFTLVELLAVIVILAIILVIAVPQIINTIDNATLGSFQSSVKLIASQADKDYLVKKATGVTIPAEAQQCSTVAKVGADHTNCTFVYNNGTAKVTVTGAEKFAGYSCTDATVDNATTACTKTS